MKINKKIFIPAMLIMLSVIVLVVTNLKAVQGAVEAVYDFCIAKFGGFFLLTNVCCMLFSVWIMFGPYRNVKLGGEVCKPTFNTFSWAGMMFTTSCGAWLIVYGFLEPIYCASQTTFEVEPLTPQAYEYGQMYAHFHWGPSAWCIYVPISVAIGYALYNRNAHISAISIPIKQVIKNKYGKFIAYLADIIAVCGSAIAPVISIGIGMPVLVRLMQAVFDIADEYVMSLQIAILGVWIIIFGTSVYLGLQKGIKRLSNINILFAFALMLVFGLLTGLSNVLNAEINMVGLFLDNFVRMSTYTDPYGDGNFVRGWTMGYWACYFVYMPLMGVFNARISKGRRLKEIAFGQLILCSLGCWVSMATLGGYTMKLQVGKHLNIEPFLETGDEAGAVIAILETLPWSKAAMLCVLILLFVFLATTMDSSAFATAEMTVQQEDSEKMASRGLRVFWAIVAAVISLIIVHVGGVKAVRALCYIMGLPLAIITFLIIFSAVNMLREDNKEIDCDK